MWSRCSVLGGLGLLLLPSAVNAQRLPTVVVVVVGEADDALRETAERATELLRGSGAIDQPTDPGILRALRGAAAPDEDDGLARLYAERESLGPQEAGNVAALGRIGRMTRSDALVLVRQRSGSIEAVVFDVARGAYFDGRVAGADFDTALVELVRTRAGAAARATASSEPGDDADEADPDAREDAPADADEGDDEPERPGRPVAPLGPDGPDGPEEEESSWVEDALPLVVGLLLLAGTIVLFALPDDPADRSPPVLRFRAGGE